MTLVHDGEEAWEIACDMEEPLYWRQHEFAGEWKWTQPECPHRRDRNRPWILAPGERVATACLPSPMPAQLNRLVAWARRPGGAWRMIASPPIPGPHEWRDGNSCGSGWLPEWSKGVRLVVTAIQIPPPWKDKPKPEAFAFDLRIENRLAVEIEYNPTSNYWLCEGFGGWAQHPGHTICGNVASHPRIPAGGAIDEASFNRGFGRYRFGMLFHRTDGDDYIAVLTEPFEVRPPGGRAAPAAPRPAPAPEPPPARAR